MFVLRIFLPCGALPEAVSSHNSGLRLWQKLCLSALMHRRSSLYLAKRCINYSLPNVKPRYLTFLAI